MKTAPSITWLADLDIESTHYSVHSKHLAKLNQAKFPIIPGFVITPDAYKNFLKENGLEQKISHILKTIAIDRPDSLMQGEHHIQQLLKHTKLPDDFIGELASFYEKLGDHVMIEVFETGRHGKKHATKSVKSIDALLKEIRNSWAEMFSSAALWRRHHQKVDHFANDAEIIVTKNTKTKHKGTVITIDPQTHAKDRLSIRIETPHEGDTYLLAKKHLVIIDRKVAHKTKEDKLTLNEIFAIARMAKELEAHLYFPQIISWSLDENGLSITNIKPVTEDVQNKPMGKKKIPISRGKGIIPTIGTGVIRILNGTNSQSINTHDILFVTEVNIKLAPKLKNIRGVVAEKNPSHAEIAFLRQYGIPTISGIKHTSRRFQNGKIITIHGGKGEIYLGGFL